MKFFKWLSKLFESYETREEKKIIAAIKRSDYEFNVSWNGAMTKRKKSNEVKL